MFLYLYVWNFFHSVHNADIHQKMVKRGRRGRDENEGEWGA